VAIDSTWTWRQLDNTGAPDARYNHDMVWDGSRVVMFGGTNWDGATITVPDDTWELVVDAWGVDSTATSPAGRVFHKMVKDGSGVLMVGGFDVLGNILDETWRLTSDWTDLAPATALYEYTPGTSYSIPAQHSLVYDGSRALAILPTYLNPGGSTNRTWEFVAGDWNRLTLPNEFDEDTFNRDRAHVASIWAGDRIVSTGGEWNTGQSFNDTIEFDGSTWDTKVANDAVSGVWLHRSRHKMVYIDGGVYMFGGCTATVGTVGTPVTNSDYFYDIGTSTWSAVSPSGTPPSARQHFAMCTDGTRVILNGGIGSGGYPFQETWVLEPEEVPYEPPADPNTLVGKLGYYHNGEWHLVVDAIV